MFRRWKVYVNICNINRIIYQQKKTFLSNEYKCSEAWNDQCSSELLNKVNLNDFYNQLDQTYSSKGVISSTDVDIFVNALKDPHYLDELRDLLHKLRMSADTGNTLESTHYATIRKYLDYGNVKDLIDILNQPLLYGVFLDDYSANLLLDTLIKSNDIENASIVASHIMKQEEFSNEITCAFCQYASYKFIAGHIPITPEAKEQSKQKVEEIKIRIKFLRNPYYDDHFDITDPLILAGKTLAWISEQYPNNTSKNLQIIGWLYYKKFDKLSSHCKNLLTEKAFKIHSEVIELLEKQQQKSSEDEKLIIGDILSSLTMERAETSLEDGIKYNIENAINKTQQADVSAQIQKFKSWAEIRELKLQDQVKRLERAKRIELIKEQQAILKQEEQKLWFFENEENIDLHLEEKERKYGEKLESKVAEQSDDEYIPPEIRPKRK